MKKLYFVLSILSFTTVTHAENIDMPVRCSVDYLNNQLEVKRIPSKNESLLMQSDSLGVYEVVYRVEPYLSKECQAIFNTNDKLERSVHNDDYNWYSEREFINGKPPKTWITLKEKKAQAKPLTELRSITK